jgi:hypothetical protein
MSPVFALTERKENRILREKSRERGVSTLLNLARNLFIQAKNKEISTKFNFSLK